MNTYEIQIRSIRFLLKYLALVKDFGIRLVTRVGAKIIFTCLSR